MVQPLPDCSTLLYYHVIKSFWVLTLPALHTLALRCGVPLPLCPWYGVAYGPGPVACGAVLFCCAVCCALCSLAALCPCPCVGVGVGLYISGPMPHGREGVPHSKGGCGGVCLWPCPLALRCCALCAAGLLCCCAAGTGSGPTGPGLAWGCPCCGPCIFRPLKNGAPRGHKKMGAAPHRAAPDVNFEACPTGALDGPLWASVFGP